jgi:hypothetical protein
VPTWWVALWRAVCDVVCGPVLSCPVLSCPVLSWGEPGVR